MLFPHEGRVVEGVQYWVLLNRKKMYCFIVGESVGWRKEEKRAKNSMYQAIDTNISITLNRNIRCNT